MEPHPLGTADLWNLASWTAHVNHCFALAINCWMLAKHHDLSETSVHSPSCRPPTKLAEFRCEEHTSSLNENMMVNCFSFSLSDLPSLSTVEVITCHLLHEKRILHEQRGDPLNNIHCTSCKIYFPKAMIRFCRYSTIHFECEKIIDMCYAGAHVL